MKLNNPEIVDVIGRNEEFIETDQQQFDCAVRGMANFCIDSKDMKIWESEDCLYEVIDESDCSIYLLDAYGYDDVQIDEDDEDEERIPTQIARVHRWFTTTDHARLGKLVAFLIKPNGKDEQKTFFVSKSTIDFLKSMGYMDERKTA